MEIRILQDFRARLDDPDNFRDFKIVAETAKDQLEDIGQALTDSGAGLVDETHAWVSEAWLRANKSGASAWDEGFAKMCAYAKSKGWVDESGRIRAHVEWK